MKILTLFLAFFAIASCTACNKKHAETTWTCPHCNCKGGSACGCTPEGCKCIEGSCKCSS